MEFLSNRITTIRNGEHAQLEKVQFFAEKGTSKNAIVILNKLREEGVIRGFSLISQGSLTKTKYVASIVESKTKKSKKKSENFSILLKYDSTGNGMLDSIFSVSIPGRRKYLGACALWQPQNTTGFFILSTTLGIMTDVEARRYNIGGEVLFGVK